MLVKFETKQHFQIAKVDIPYTEVWINPRYVVSVQSIPQDKYKGHTGITTCAREGEEENQYFIVKGEAKDIVASLSIQHNG
jgi:hypothetical protein